MHFPCKPHGVGLDIPHHMGFAMIDFEQHAADYRDAFRIWDEPQFTVSDVCALTGATPKAIEHFVDPSRNMVRLVTREANPGKGRRRLFTGGQVLMIKVAYVMNAIGFPQKFSATMAEQVLRRATGLTNGVADQTKMHLISYPMANGDWAAIPIYAETEKEPQLPVAVQVLDVDRLVRETRAQLEAIVEGQEIPDWLKPEKAGRLKTMGQEAGDFAENVFSGAVMSGVGSAAGTQNDINGDGVIDETDAQIGSAAGLGLFAAPFMLRGAKGLGAMFKGETKPQGMAPKTPAQADEALKLLSASWG
jgi:hypothetical protein